MKRHQFLRGVHRKLRPRTYLEIGVRDGLSLALSRCPTIAVDPAFAITREIDCDVELVRSTSDDFFARPDPVAKFGSMPADLAFIDGMHLSEFAFRDFVNVERFTGPASAVVFDDMLPRNVDEAARDRHTTAWAGDVYKVALVLERERPDLVVIPVDTQPTGTVLILGLDPANTTLRERSTALQQQMITDDPQDVPALVRERTYAVQPEALLGAGFWPELRKLRRSGAATTDAVRTLLAACPEVAPYARGPVKADRATPASVRLGAQLLRRRSS